MTDEFADLRRRVAQHRRETDALIERAMRFPAIQERLANIARNRLKRLIAARKSAGNWPPAGDWPETDAELSAAISAAAEEEQHEGFHGTTFRAAVAVAKRKLAKDHTTKVLQRCHAQQERQQDRQLQVRRAVLRNRVEARGLLTENTTTIVRNR
jgi:hypothetical protein